MSDYISREAAIEAFEKELSAKYNRIELSIGFVGAKSILSDLPAADVVERKKGKWINHGQYADFFPHCEYRCSECDTPYLEIEMIYNYCPNCGARMER